MQLQDSRELIKLGKDLQNTVHELQIKVEILSDELKIKDDIIAQLKQESKQNDDRIAELNESIKQSNTSIG